MKNPYRKYLENAVGWRQALNLMRDFGLAYSGETQHDRRIFWHVSSAAAGKTTFFRAALAEFHTASSALRLLRREPLVSGKPRPVIAIEGGRISAPNLKLLLERGTVHLLGNDVLVSDNGCARCVRRIEWRRAEEGVSYDLSGALPAFVRECCNVLAKHGHSA